MKNDIQTLRRRLAKERERVSKLPPATSIQELVEKYPYYKHMATQLKRSAR